MSSGRRCVSVLLHPQVDVIYHLGEFRHAVYHVVGAGLGHAAAHIGHAGFQFRAGEGVHFFLGEGQFVAAQDDAHGPTDRRVAALLQLHLPERGLHQDLLRPLAPPRRKRFGAGEEAVGDIR